jgi:hypothetical protein
LSDCIACKIELPEGAPFCSACGKSQVHHQPATGSDPPLQRTASEAAESARRAAVGATNRTKSLVAELGVEKTLCAVGGALSTLGAILPYVSFSISSGQLSTSLQISLLQSGVPGWLVLLAGITLGGVPFILRLSSSISLAGVSLCTIVLAKLFGDWFALGMAQSIVQSLMQTVSSQIPSYLSGGAQGGVAFNGAAGFICLFVGFAILLFAYVRSARA